MRFLSILCLRLKKPEKNLCNHTIGGESICFLQEKSQRERLPLAFSKVACHASFLMWNILRRMKPQNFEPFTTTTFIAKTSQLCSAPQERDSQYHQYDRHHKHDQTDRAEARANKAQAKCDGTLPHLRANCTFTAFPSAPHFPSPRFPYVYQRQCFFCSAVVTVYTQGTVLVPEKIHGNGQTCWMAMALWLWLHITSGLSGKNKPAHRPNTKANVRALRHFSMNSIQSVIYG